MRLSLSSSKSSTSHPRPLYRSSRSQIFFKIGVPKNFANFVGKHRCFTEHLRWLLLSMLLFMNVSSFTSSPLPHFHYFLTVLLLSSFEETLSSLYHCYYIITIITAEWFIRIAATATTYCTAISMIVICIRHVISLIFQEFMISLNSVSSLTKQMQTY